MAIAPKRNFNMTLIQNEQEQDDDTGLNLLVEDENVQLISSKIEQARELVDANDPQKAIELCQEILDLGDLPVPFAAKAAGVLRSLGQIEAADKIKTVIVEELDRVHHRLKSPEYALSPPPVCSRILGRRRPLTNWDKRLS